MVKDGNKSEYGFNTLVDVLTYGIKTPSKKSMVKEIMRSFMDGNDAGVDSFDFSFGGSSNTSTQTDPIDELINSID